MSFQESDNLWWDAFTTEFFEDDAILTLAFCLEDGPKRYSKSLCCFFTIENVQLLHLGLLPTSGVAGMVFYISFFHLVLSNRYIFHLTLSMLSFTCHTSLSTRFSVRLFGSSVGPLGGWVTWVGGSLLSREKIIGKSFQNSTDQ